MIRGFILSKNDKFYLFFVKYLYICMENTGPTGWVCRSGAAASVCKTRFGRFGFRVKHPFPQRPRVGINRVIHKLTCC